MRTRSASFSSISARDRSPGIAGKNSVSDAEAVACSLENPEACEALCNIIRDNGAKFGIDHFGRQFGSMSYLQSLRPSYVKLDQSFAYYDENQHNAELCRALVNVARGLEIQVIVTGIQEKPQLERFMPLKTTAYQGFIAPPEPVQ